MLLNLARRDLDTLGGSVAMPRSRRLADSGEQERACRRGAPADVGRGLSSLTSQPVAIRNPLRHDGSVVRVHSRLIPETGLATSDEQPRKVFGNVSPLWFVVEQVAESFIGSLNQLRKSHDP